MRKAIIKGTNATCRIARRARREVRDSAVSLARAKEGNGWKKCAPITGVSWTAVAKEIVVITVYLYRLGSYSSDNLDSFKALFLILLKRFITSFRKE